MRIEINSQKSGIATISGFQTDYTALLNETDSVIGALNRMKSYSYSMNGGLGVLQNAVGDIDSRIQAEESKRTALQTAQQKCNSFFILVSQTDNSCAGMVSQNQEEFYQVNQWAAPSALTSMMDSWYQSATKWIKESARVAGEKIEHSIKVYTETDFSAMSTEELQKYRDELLDKLNNDSLSDDDRIRLNAFLNYLSNIEISENLSEDEQRKVELYNSLYSKLHPDETVEITKFFENSSQENGFTDYERQVISYLAYTSESPQHELLFKYIGQCEVSDFNATHTDDNGNQSPGCWYSPDDRTIHLNRSSWSNFSAYHGIFEEIGHNIDDLMDGSKNGELESTIGSYSARLDNALKTDVSNYMWRAIDSYNDDEAWFKIDGPGKQKLHDVFMGEARYEDLNPRLRVAYNNIYASTFGGLNSSTKWYEVGLGGFLIQAKRTERSTINSTTASDAVSSQIPSTYNAGHNWNGDPNWGNGERYNEDYDKTEVFSQYMANGICNKALYRKDRELLPETYQVMDEMAKSALNR